MVIQLLMNSMYGKTIIEPVETYTIVKDNIKKETVESSLSHYDYVHCGVDILSMSNKYNELCFRLCQ